MKYMSILEKLLCLVDLIKDSWLDLIFVGLSLLLIILFITKKITRKKCLFGLLGLYLGLLAFTIYHYFLPLSSTANNIIDHFFTSIYFPSIYVYLFVFIFLNIVCIISLLGRRWDKVYQTINTIFSFFMNLIFLVILEIISKNKVDLFSKTSLFANTNLVVMLELSISLFIIWSIAIIGIYITNVLTEKISLKREQKLLQKKTLPEKELSVSVNEEQLEKEYNQEKPQLGISPLEHYDYQEFAIDRENNHFIPNLSNYSQKVSTANQNTAFMNPQVAIENAYQRMTEVEMETMNRTNATVDQKIQMENTNFDLSSFIPRKQDVMPIHSMNSTPSNHQIFHQILNNELPMIRETTSIPNTSMTEPVSLEKDSYTLNDYRIFNKMLKEIKEHNQSNVIQIDKNLEYRLITKYSNETYNLFKKMLKNYSN